MLNAACDKTESQISTLRMVATGLEAHMPAMIAHRREGRNAAESNVGFPFQWTLDSLREKEKGRGGNLLAR